MAELLTGPGGSLDQGRELREKCAIFDDGRVLVARTYQGDTSVAGVVALARRLKVPVRSPEYVDLARIREAYGSADDSKEDAADKEELHEVKQEVLDLIRRAVRERASDVIVVVDNNGMRIRMRIDGELAATEHYEGTEEFGHQVLRAAFQACAQTDSNYDPTRPQSAALAAGDRHGFGDRLPAEVQALRLHFNPVGPGGRGRNLAMRIQKDQGEVGADFSELGYSVQQIEALETLMEDGEGVGIWSGPTGSGKTTALECFMRRLATRYPGENLMSVEDPPEYRMPHVIQLAVTNTRTEEDRGLAFTEAIAGCMRSNPDRMMVGEIRTLASASLVFQFALSGHPAYTTVHANSALGIVTRLSEMGIAAYLLRDASVVRMLLAQRLVGRLCEHCSVPASEGDLGSELARMLGSNAVPRLAGQGCDRCRGGYRGRTVVAETIRPDETLLALLVEGRRAEADRYWRETLGGISMAGHALTKIAAGEVSAQLVRYDSTRGVFDLRKVGR